MAAWAESPAELAGRLHRLLSAGDVDAALGLARPGALIFAAGGAPRPLTRESLGRAVGDVAVEIEAIIGAGEQAVILAVTLSSPATGTRKLFHLLRFSGSKLSELHLCHDILDALDAAGVG